MDTENKEVTKKEDINDRKEKWMTILNKTGRPMAFLMVCCYIVTISAAYTVGVMEVSLHIAILAAMAIINPFVFYMLGAYTIIKKKMVSSE